jgi:hypothetical protein
MQPALCTLWLWLLPIASLPPLSQVRQLQALGVRLRRDIMAEVEVASKFYRWGRLWERGPGG